MTFSCSNSCYPKLSGYPALYLIGDTLLFQTDDPLININKMNYHDPEDCWEK